MTASDLARVVSAVEKVESIVEQVTAESFDESGYLAFNQDVHAAITNGLVQSAHEHFDKIGHKENRHQFGPGKLERVTQLRAAKLERVKFDPTLQPEPLSDHKLSYLTDDLKEQFHIVPTANVSSNNYDPKVIEIIEANKDGIILDCGAGERSDYYSNVLNYEIANYWSTDVLGVGERLPFEDESFDAIISVAVLEHVKDPFQCASEIARVLKKGGTLFSAIPFLQPYHGYPHHYYNMTHQGHRNLYDHTFEDIEVSVYESLRPIFTLTWFLNSYSNGLPRMTKRKFLNMKVKDLLASPISFLGEDFVRQLSDEADFELASGTVLIGKKA